MCVKILPSSPCANILNSMFSAVWPECADMDVKNIKIAYIASKVAVSGRNFSRAMIQPGHLNFFS